MEKFKKAQIYWHSCIKYDADITCTCIVAQTKSKCTTMYYKQCKHKILLSCYYIDLFLKIGNNIVNYTYNDVTAPTKTTPDARRMNGQTHKHRTKIVTASYYY